VSFNVAMLKQMQAEGLDLDACIRVLEAGEKKRDKTNAKRQARHRARKASNAVTVTPVTPPNEEEYLTPPCVEKPEPKGSVKKFVRPSDIPAEPWDAWIEMRRRIRKNPTDHAKSLAVAELRRLRDEEGWPPGEVLNHCTMNSYQGIYPPKAARNDNSIGKSAAAFSMLNASPDEPF